MKYIGLLIICFWLFAMFITAYRNKHTHTTEYIKTVDTCLPHQPVDTLTRTAIQIGGTVDSTLFLPLGRYNLRVYFYAPGTKQIIDSLTIYNR